MDSQLSATHFRVLLADDDKDDRFFFKKALDSLPGSYSLEMVADGEELMDYLDKNCDHLPDVIFLDINMPRKNGIECLEEIKHDGRLSKVAVVIYSTSGFNATAKALYEQGAHYYFQKCDYFELVSNLEAILTTLKRNPERPAAGNFFFHLQTGK